MKTTREHDLADTIRRHPAGSALPRRAADELDVESARSVGIFCTEPAEAIEAALVWLSARAGQELEKQAHYADCAGAVLEGFVTAQPPGVVVDMTPHLTLTNDPAGAQA